MSFVATYVARHSLSIEDVYGDELDDAGPARDVDRDWLRPCGRSPRRIVRA
jgi:hypothetical protein